MGTTSITSDLKARIIHKDGLHAYGVMQREAVVNGKELVLKYPSGEFGSSIFHRGPRYTTNK